MSLFDKYEKVEESGMKGWYRLGFVLSAASIYLYDTIAHFLFCKMGVEGV